MTLTASYQKVFSDNPKIGFFAQRDKFQQALDHGKVVSPAKSIDDMHAVVTNSTVDGILAAIFAVLIIVVIADAMRVWVRAIAARAPLPTTEAEFVESRLVAPAGLFPTAEERALLAGAGAGDGVAAVAAGHGERFSRRQRTTSGGGP